VLHLVLDIVDVTFGENGVIAGQDEIEPWDPSARVVAKQATAGSA
jgi:hypothetical protein